MSFFTEQSDPYRAKQYEQAVKWWMNFNGSQSPLLTDRQAACIYAIQKHNPEAPEFKGSSIAEASEYISMWGYNNGSK